MCHRFGKAVHTLDCYDLVLVAHVRIEGLGFRVTIPYEGGRVEQVLRGVSVRDSFSNVPHP